MIKLRDKVKDTVNGFTGIVTSRTEYLNGCIQFGVMSDKLKDGLPQKLQWIDEDQLTVTRKAARSTKKKGKKLSGGPQETPERSETPTR